MAQPTQDALSALEDAVGDIDEFARKELGYASVEDLHTALMGLQVDSVAMAIHQIKKDKAVVIADQTGIGKGRQAAAIIRWAAKSGFTPVFISVKPSLFTDMYGDLADIGTDDVRPFIMNGDAWIAGANGEKLFSNKLATHRARLGEIESTSNLPDDKNAVFMTYSQINVDNVQRRALMALAPNAVFVLDESHNAAGASATGDFVIGALGLAKGVTYLSATYAKRPDNMPLYFKTDIGNAAADTDGLASAMSAGGLPLQTVVSNNLVKAGQMFRRERSYDGVQIASVFDTANRPLHERMSDEATKALRAIVSADRAFHSGYVKNLEKDLAAQGQSIKDTAGNQASAGVQHTEFSSVVHNFVKQMLLGLKAQSAADEAIASLKRGEKPIIAVENTMGSFLGEYAASNNIAQGDMLGSFDYRTVLSRALERTRVIVIKDAQGNERKEKVPLSQLDSKTRITYEQSQAVINGLKLDIPVSPIDWMRSQIIKAGYQVAEITGRNLSVDYSDASKPVLSAIDQLEQSDKVNTTRQFNSGKLDALILNVAGSTGISLHASEKFEDQRQRHMIVAQAAGDINIFMQMLGRIHRTGQVALPKYTILSVDLPTEKRPTAVLSVKMKSLNANTSSNTESATSVKTSDILNKYGDQIVQQYLNENYQLAMALDVQDLIGGNTIQDDLARKVTGRLALQPIEIQHAFYDEVEGQYNGLIDYLNKTNQNDLEPRTFDFDAKETRQEVLFEGPDKSTPFGEDAIYGEYSIKAQGIAMKPEEIREAMKTALDGKTPEAHINGAVATLLQTWIGQINENRRKNGLVPGAFDEDKYASFVAGLYGKDSAQSFVDAAKAQIARGNAVEDIGAEQIARSNDARIGIEFMRAHAIGKTFRVDINSEPYNAVVTSIRSTHKQTGNPFSLSKIQLTVSVNGALRSLSIPASQFRKIEVSSIAAGFRVEQLFKEQPLDQRETAKIVTGNLLAAYGEIDGARGTIISFTKQDGTTEQGILLPKLFDYSKNTRGDFRLSTGEMALRFLQQSENRDIGRFGIMSRDGNVRVLPSGRGIRVQVPKSKAKGGKFFLDKTLIEAGGDFVSSGNYMVSTVYDPQPAINMLDLLMKKQALYTLPSMAEEAKVLAGDAPALSRSTDPVATTQSTQAVEKIVQGITSRWANAPEVVVVYDMTDPRIPAKVRARDMEQRSGGAKGDPEGFFLNGKAYIVASQVSTPKDVARVLFHESLGHFGLRGVFGEQLKPILQQLAGLRRAEVAAKAKQYGLDMGIESERLQAAEEVLAEMAQTRPEMGFVKRAIAVIRSWLRRNVPGFKNMALTDADIISNFLIPARGFVERGQQSSVGERVPAFSRAAVSEPTAPDSGGAPMFSRSKANAITKHVTDKLNETFNHPGKLSWWDKTVGSMYNLAERSPPFKRVFDAAQDFINDVSFYANDAADMAPTILPKLDSWKDLRKTPVSAIDNKAISVPILEGTLSWARDPSGKPVRVADADENAGVVWTDAELKSMFNLNPAQIVLYREFRAATDKSLDNLAKADLMRFGGKDVADLREMVMQAKDADEAAKLLNDYLMSLAGADLERADALKDTAQGMTERGSKVAKLKSQGYAPLSRFGRYSVDVVADGKREYFGLFESARAANLMAIKLKSEFGEANVAQGTLSQKEFEQFAGITPESLELFGNMLGLDSTGNKAQDEAFQTYLKLTKTNRSAMKRMIHRKGTAGFSEDIGRVLAAFVYSNARQTSAALHMGDIGEAVNDIPKGQGDLKDAAIELTSYVKQPREEAQALRGLLFAQYLGGSIASAFVNFTQPLTVSFPYLSQFGGAKKAGAALIRAMKDQREGVVLGVGLAHALRKAEEQGIVSPQSVHELMAQAQGRAALNSGDGTRTGDAMAFAQNNFSKLALGWGKLFGLAEQINRRSTFIAAYRIAVEQKITNPAEFATKAVNETQFISNKANKAKFARGAVGATLMTFKSYSINYLELLYRMATQNGSEGKMAAALMLGMLFLMAGAGGLPFDDDLEDLADFFGQRMGYNFSSKKAKQEFLESVFGKAGAQFIDKGISGLPGVPIDTSGRMSMGNLIPGTGLFLKKRDHTGDVQELFGPAGDLVKRAFQAGDQILSGNFGKAALTMAPKAVYNAAKGADMAGSNAYNDDKGYKVIETTPFEAAMKAIGFQPASVAKVQESNYLHQRAKDFYSINVQEIQSVWAKGIYEKDKAQIDRARDMLKTWNEDNPDQRINANLPAIIRKAREMGKTKDQRIDGTAPKAMRAELRRESAEVRGTL